MLPKEFSERMKEMLGGEYGEFLACWEKEKYQGLRVNTLKAGAEELPEKSPFTLSPVPWARDGWYYQASDQPGKHPYHEAGVYYIQEPSAMAPVEWLDVKPGERILDLCAAPGGKSTQIAARLQGEGLLVSNEIHPARAKILSENVERMGIRNAMVTNESPERMAEVFPGYFDRILVDAPCSGEGMFRKNTEACGEWSPENVILCAQRQDIIMDCAAAMLRPGGRLVYSTCTFAPLENEGTVSRFLSRHPDYSIICVDQAEGMEPGRADWVDAPAQGLERTVRLWPHKLKGEGHYGAALRKAGPEDGFCRGFPVNGIEKSVQWKDCGEYPAFQKEYLKVSWEGGYLKYGDQLYLIPPNMPAVKGLKVLRPGLHLGTLKKNRFEPSHALALALRPQESVRCWNLSADDPRAAAYLRGETFPAAGEKGWYLIAVDGYSLGWGKLAGGVMKNHYPKGLRV